MKRRNFLRTGIALGSTALLNKLPENILLAKNEVNNNTAAYQPGEQISSEAFVLDNKLKAHTLLNLCQRKTLSPVIVLYIFGGAAAEPKTERGGLWCTDSFEDLYILRYLHRKYSDHNVGFIPVACTPIYSSQYYGYPEGVFLNEPDGSEAFRKNTRTFIENTEKIVGEGIIPDETYFDLRHRLLFNRRPDLKPGNGYGKIHAWQGKFRAGDETQKYGVPTIWLLDTGGVVLEPPFSGNYYHSDPYEISYSVIEVDEAVQKYL